ncbi:MAG: 6-bladed beta-propeller [Desulfuromonadales bacterium]|nr:6-bladed beta-propeller [Desulfuromonadales bacterium]
MSHKNIFFSLTPLFTIVLFFFFSVPILAAQKDDVRLKAILAQDNNQQPLAYPTSLFYDSEADEVYVVDAGNTQLVLFDQNGYPTDSVGKGRGLSNISSGLRHQKKLYVCCGSNNEFLSGSINVLDNAFFPEQRLILATERPDQTTFIVKRVMAHQNGRFYVLQNGNSAVSIFNKGWTFSHQISPPHEHLGVQEPAPIVDMAQGRNGTMYFLSEKWGRIFVYGENEEPLFSFGEKGGDKGKLARARGIAVDSRNDRIYISDYLRHTVLVYNMKGQWLYEIGGKGTRPGYFFYPSSVCVDNNGILYVADTFNNRVQIFSINPLPTDKS